MLQVLGLFDKGIAAIFYSIVAGIYSTVAKIYDIMLDLVYQPNESFANIALADILDAVYVLAGVFMLFRVIISMIQMFINPDQVTDSSAGAGKLLTRVVVSIVLLIALQPSGFILGDTGLLKNIERAVLADDGIITRIINAEPGTNLSSANSESIDNILIEDVYAANSLTCYYVGVNSHTSTLLGGGAATYHKHNIVINDVYKIQFYNVSDVAGKSGDQKGNINCSSGGCKYSYVVKSGTNIAGNESNGKYSSLNGKITMGNAFDGSFPSSCPKYLEKKTNSNGETYYAAKKGNGLASDKIEKCTDSLGRDIDGNCKNVGIMGGYSSFSELNSVINKVIADKEGTNAKNRYELDSTNKWISGLSNFVNTEDTDGKYTYLSGVDYEAVAFAQTTGGTFIDCSGNDECDEAKNEMFKTSDGNNTMVGYIADDTATLDWFTGAIVGIALIVYLLVLCIDVIVRRLKLVFMEMLSPIPVVSYVDPKDKMFNTWFKMYLSTYVDLFIKLIAMAILVNLLKLDNLTALWGNDSSLLVKFFYIVAILVFAKLIPSMISKIFGIDSMGGSFKDIIGMAKGAAGFGAGAALGAGAGVLAMGAGIKNGKDWKQKLGAGVSGLGSIASGTLRGAGAGSKGKPMAGASAVLADAQKQRAARASGAKWWDTKKAGILGTLGFDDAYMAAKRKKTAMDDVVNTAGSLEDEALSKVNKAIGAGYGSKFANLVEARNDAQAAKNGDFVNRYKRVYDEASGTTTFVDKLGINTKTFNNDELDIETANQFASTGLTVAEAEARIKGAEKGATQDMLNLFNTGKAESLGFNKDDIAEMNSLRMDADSAARQAGYKDGYSKANKTDAKQKRKEYAAQMRDAEASHNVSQK